MSPFLSPLGLSMDVAQFETLVAEAMDRLPRRYRRLIRNVVVLTEQEPSREIKDELGIPYNHDLLGVYTGVPMGQESFFDMGGRLPPRIIIFRGPILRRCSSYEEARDEILKTVIHEIGHHFGLNDSQMPY
ncbi:MAG: metallopeptidase family protein [Desulfobacteraceae bacterium]|jgi:predicted Zn-dependent protease with MMP-like domain|nr:MAG: metallopeptidase family protein [Desulfobacteraceae bacterium]